jgi:two-component system phosphate regulon sensor histidine kinase PhoR
VLLLRDISREARTNRLRAELVSSVSHELKTPITLIHLYGETLLRHAGFREEERSDFYRIIVRESARLGRLVDQVLSFARVERGTQTYVVDYCEKNRIGIYPVVSSRSGEGRRRLAR